MKEIKHLKRMAERARKAAFGAPPEIAGRHLSLAEAFAEQAAILKNKKPKAKKKKKQDLCRIG